MSKEYKHSVLKDSSWRLPSLPTDGVRKSRNPRWMRVPVANQA